MNLLRTIANWFGYDVIRQSRDILLERHLHNLFSSHDINCVIDAGANHGQYARSLRTMGFSGEIHSFEPLSAAFEELAMHAENDNAWHCYQHALGRNTETKPINVTAYDDFSSFLEPNEYSAETFRNKSMVDHQELVEIRRLDDVLPAETRHRTIHLKMDTQGFDLEVFAGAGGILDSVRSLQSEISVTQLYEGMPDYLSALSTFRDAGFLISGLFPVTRDKKSLAVIEFDCVMVKP